MNAVSIQGNNVVNGKGNSLFRKLFSRTSVIKALRKYSSLYGIGRIFPAIGSGSRYRYRPSAIR